MSQNSRFLIRAFGTAISCKADVSYSEDIPVPPQDRAADALRA
jgi:hypothetical protein